MPRQPLNLSGVHGKLPIFHKVVYELRYREGFTYLDKCGRIINRIHRHSPEWVIQGDAAPQGASLVSMESGAVFNFSAISLGLGLEMPLGGDPLDAADTAAFITAAEDLTSLVVDQLGIGPQQVTRIGFRPWFLFSCADEDESARWLQGLGCYAVLPQLAASFGGRIESTVVSVVIVGEDRHFRIGFSGAERQAQIDLGQGILNIRPRSLSKDQLRVLQDQLKARRRIRQNPEFVAMVDIDCYQEDPQIIDIRHFLETSWDQAYHRFQKAVGG